MTKLSNYAITEDVSGGWQVSSDATDPNKEYLFCLRARNGGSFPITISVQDYEQPALSPSLNAYPIRGPFVNDGQVTPNNSTVSPEQTLKNGYYYYQDGSLVFLDAPNYQVTSLSACLNPFVEIVMPVPEVPTNGISCANAGLSSAPMLFAFGQLSAPVTMKMAINNVEVGSINNVEAADWVDWYYQGLPSSVSDILTINYNNPAPLPYVVDGPFDIPQRHPIFDLSGLRAIGAQLQVVVGLELYYNGKVFYIDSNFTDQTYSVSSTVNSPVIQTIGDELHFPYFDDPEKPNVPYRLLFCLQGADPLQYPDFVSYVDTVPSSAQSFINYGNGNYGFNVETMTTHSIPLLSHQNNLYLSNFFGPANPQRPMYCTLSVVGVTATGPLSQQPPMTGSYPAGQFVIPPGATLQQLADLINQRLSFQNDEYGSNRGFSNLAMARIVDGMLVITNNTVDCLLTINLYNVSIGIFSGGEGSVSGHNPITADLIVSFDQVNNVGVYESFSGVTFTLAPMGLGGKFVTMDIKQIFNQQDARVMFYSPYSSFTTYDQVTWYDPDVTNQSFIVGSRTDTNGEKFYGFCLSLTPPVVIPPEPLPSISCSSSNNEVIFTVTESNTQTGNFKFEYELNGEIQLPAEFLSIQELYEALNNIGDFDVVMLEHQPEEL